jgi:RNA polymerase sigma-70 factor (ECF subfamily)
MTGLGVDEQAQGDTTGAAHDEDQGRKLRLFEQCILPHLDAAHDLARWMTRNDHDAQDIVQEGYLRAFRFFMGIEVEMGSPS